MALMWLLTGWLTALAGLEITQYATEQIIGRLDESLSMRQTYVEQRQKEINRLVDSLATTSDYSGVLLEVANRYAGFNNDSAMHYFNIGVSSPRVADKLPFVLGSAKILPLSGFFSPAIELYESVDTTGLKGDRLALYYDSGRQMYSYMAAFSGENATYRRDFEQEALELQNKLLGLLPHDSLDYEFNLGEYYFLTGHSGRSRALLEHVVENTPEDSPLRARAAHHLSQMNKQRGDDNSAIYYLATSALADVSAATREVASLQDLGNELYSRGAVDRAYRYLTEALSSAVECGAPLRMIESSRSLPIIERAYSAQLDAKRKTIYIIVGILIVVVIVLVITMIVLNHKMHRLRVLQTNLRQANQVKEVYISQFLNLCSIYMDKLNQFCKIANRKITAGKVDDLYRLTKSGKFVEEQSKEFYEVLDRKSVV